MDAEEFVTALKLYVSDSEATNLAANLRQPPGRRPHATLVRLSTWFNQLVSEDQSFVTELIRAGAEGAIFGVLCVLDGVRAVEDGPEKGTFELYYVKNGERILLSPPNDSFHDLFQSLRGHGKNRWAD